MNMCTDPSTFHVPVPVTDGGLAYFGVLALAVCSATGCGEPNAIVVIDKGGEATMVVGFDSSPSPPAPG